MLFVTGCARSGTSLIAKLLQAHGANLGQPNRVNVLYENVGIRQNVLKPYLSSIGADPIGQSIPLPDTSRLPKLEHLREKVLNYIEGNEPRAYKDAKLCHVFPLFAAAFPEAKWIIVRRDKECIVDSCLRERTSEGFGRFMKRSSDPAYWRKWVEAHEARFGDMLKALPNIVQVWPDVIIKDPSAFAALAAFCGLDFNLKTTEAAIIRKLWNG